MWHLKTTIAPVIVRALGMIKKETDKGITRYLIFPTDMKYKKIVLCRTDHLCKKVL